MDYQSIRRNYAGTLDGLERLAWRDMLAWWNLTEGTPFLQRRKLLQDPFTAIAQAYGEQAAHAAADYLFLQRSLDETLARLDYPEIAHPVSYEQAVAAYRNATTLSDKDFKKFIEKGKDYAGDGFNAVTLEKLSGALNRQVLLPARQTVMNNIPAGMKFARVPNPGACPWCLMLASRGAVYSKDTAMAAAGGSDRYHDNCRCVAIEVGPFAPLPRINQELEAAWQHAQAGGGTQADMYRNWDAYLKRRSAVLQSQVRFPDIPGVKTPTYKGNGKRIAQVKLPGGEIKDIEIPLPDLHQMPGHVIYGWNTASPFSTTHHPARGRKPGDYSMDNAHGHRHGSLDNKKTTFPAHWSDQKIVDAVRDVLENGEIYEVQRAPSMSLPDVEEEKKTQKQRNKDKGKMPPAYDYRVRMRGMVDGQEVETTYRIVDGVGFHPTGYPIKNSNEH